MSPNTSTPVQTRRFSDQEKEMAESNSASRPGADTARESGAGSTGESYKSTSYWAYNAILAVVALLIALATIPSPRVPTEADQEATADASWCAVLEYAHQHGLQFGTDIVFTYGPLGFLTTPYLFSTPAGPRFAVDLALAFVTALSVCSIARRLRVPWATVLITVYLLLGANIYPRTDLLLELNLVCWGILCIAATGRSLVIYGLTLAGVAIFASLVKITLLIIAVMTIVLVSCDLLLRNYRRLGLGLVGLFLSGLILAWMAAGQNVLHLGTFLCRALITSLGYNNAMAYEGSVVLRGRALLTGCLAAATIITTRCGFTGSRFLNFRQLLLAGWLFGLLFLVWKHGFVRTDLYHAGFFFGFAPILALAWASLADGNSDRSTTRGDGEESRGASATFKLILSSPFLARAFAVSCTLFALFTVQTMILPGDWQSSIAQPFLAIRANALNLLRPAAYQQQISAAVEAEKQRNQLGPLHDRIAQSTVDMFGCEQLAVLANGLNFRPRPVFQSYAAYSPSLMEWNQAFYQSQAAPEFVIFRLLGMDRKLPTLEDALVLRYLLINYELVASEVPFLLLQAKLPEPPKLKLLKQETISPGELLKLSGFGTTNLWLEMELKPTLLGRAREFLYQPAKSRLVVSWSANGKESTRRFRAPAPMLAAGFLLSPLLLTADDVRGLYQGVEPHRPNACSIEFNPGDEKFWQRTIRFRVYAIENTLGRRTVPGF
jgi:hypothetical protein